MKNSALLFSLLFPLFISSSKFWDYITKNYWKKWLGNLKQDDQLPEEFTFDKIQATNEYTFGILDGNVWKIDFEEMKSNVNSLFNEKIVENYMINEEEDWYFDNDVKINEDYSHILLLNSYKDTIHELFQEAISTFEPHYDQELSQNLIIKIQIETYSYESAFGYSNVNIVLKVLKKKNDEWDSIYEKADKFKCDFHYPLLHGIKLLNNGDIIILTQYGLLIYHFSENDKTFSLNYFYEESLISKESLSHIYNKIFSKPALPLPNYKSFESNDGWVSDIINNKIILLKYGVELLNFAIKKHKIELVDEIYKKCINYFEKDFSNKMILSIITSTMPLLNEYYPEYIERYSLETMMILNSYGIEYQINNLHLYSFQYPQLVNLSQSILWFKYNEFMRNLFKNHKRVFTILSYIQSLIIFLLLPIYFFTFFILSKFNFFDRILTKEIYSSLYFKVIEKIPKSKRTPKFIFMNPYIKFLNYPKDYNWFMELIKPQSSPFVETINRDIYKTWNGESLINFKWDNYGKYYYAIIWIVFIVFLGCFTIAATIPYIEDDVKNQLLIATIILGFIHLSFEVRQIIYNPIKWIQNFWNIFGKYIYI
jgi:hypothetical protein